MIQWDQIVAECDGFRAGFVAVFRKYEGEKTDEKDAQGRTVKVSTGSFSRHVGISESTFRRWIKHVDEGAALSGRTAVGGGPARSGQVGRQIAKSASVAVDDKVGMLKDLLSDKRVVKAWQAERTPDVSEADAKASRALVRAIVEPIVNAAMSLQVPMMLDQLDSVVTFLSEYDLEAEDIRKFDRRAKKLVEEVEVQKFRHEEAEV